MTLHRFRAVPTPGWAWGLVALALCLGCGGAGAPPVSPGPDPDDGGGAWTVMVYMAADNDLGEDALRDLNEMEAIGSGVDLSIVVQIDLPDTGGYPWTTARRYLVERDTDTENVGSTLPEDLGELDMTRPETLAGFLAWARAAYPSDHTLVLLWGHGEAWDHEESAAAGGASSESRIQAIFNDESADPDTLMRNHELGSALASAGGAFDIVAMDACAMQILEVAYELRGSASILLASQEVLWEDGFPYDAFLAPLAASPSTTPENLARSMVQAFGSYYEDLVPVRREQCLSAVRLAAAGSVALAADGVANALLARLPDLEIVAGLTALRRGMEDFTAVSSRYVDLSSLAEGLPILGVDTAPLAAALQAAVIDSYSGSGHPGATGLSIYFPLDRAHYDLDDSYANHDPATGQGSPCAFVNAYHWDELLAELYGG